MSAISKSNENLTIFDDGTNIIISFRGKKLFRFRKSDNQMEVELGINTDTTL